MRRLTALFLVLTAAAFFFRCYVHEPAGDELRYCYVWENDDPTTLWQRGHRYERHVATVADIVQTQRIHYVKANGRTPVHALEQAFSTGPAAWMLFCVLNTLVWLLLVWLTVAYSTGGARALRASRSALLWVLVVVALLYLMPFQRSLWTSVNYGLNYLWPSAMTVGFLLMWRHLSRTPSPSVALRVAAACLGLLAGWSNEAFATGMAAGVVLWLAAQLLHRRRPASRMLWLALPLLAGFAVMLASPGNWHRLGQAAAPDNWVRLRVGSLFYTLSCLRLVWLLAAVALVAVVASRRRVVAFVRANAMLVACWAGTAAFMAVVSKGTHSMCGLELLSLLIVLRYASASGFFECIGRRTAAVLALVTGCWVLATQALICRDTLAVYRYQHALVDAYRRSPDGLVRCDEPSIADFSRPYIRLWELPPTAYTEILSLEQIYGRDNKSAVLLASADYDAVADTAAFYARARRVPGTAGAWADPQGGLWMWLRAGSYAPGDTFRVVMEPVRPGSDVDLDTRLNRIAWPMAWPDSYDTHPDTVRTRYGEAYRISIPRRRKLLRLDRLPVLE